MARKRKGEGQTVLVTGASAGIGVDLAACFAKDGYNLILAARSGEALREVAQRLADAHKVTATPIALDLGVPAAVRSSPRRSRSAALPSTCSSTMQASASRAALRDRSGTTNSA